MYEVSINWKKGCRKAKKKRRGKGK